MTPALLTGAATTAWSTWVLPATGWSPRRRAWGNAGFALAVTAAAGVNRGRLGLTNAADGLRWGARAAAIPVVGAAVTLAVPALRKRVRPADDALAEWVLFRIPVGTVLTEELLFRGVFDAVAPAASPIFFGLWHIHPARAAGDSVIGTVFVTTVAGLGFSWLRRRSDSLLAPALLHYAINASGAVVAHLAHRIENQGRELG